MRALLLLALALPLAGCGGEEEAPLDEIEAAQSIREIATAAPPKEPDHRPVLAALAPGDLGPELAAGTRCEFRVGEHLAFASAGGNGAAKVNGRVVGFTSTAPVGPTGGYFVGGGYTLSVGRTRGEETAAKGTTSPGRIAVSDHSRTERPVRELRGTWRCG